MQIVILSTIKLDTFNWEIHYELICPMFKKWLVVFLSHSLILLTIYDKIVRIQNA